MGNYISLNWNYEQDSDFLNHRVENLCEDHYTIENSYSDAIDLDYSEFSGGMLFLVASGTAVKLKE